MPFPAPPPIELYWVYVGFDQIEPPSQREYFQHMATSFYLPKQQVDDLRRIGARLLEQSEDFQRLLNQLH